MRLWDFRLLPYLPDSQLLAQKGECDLIIKDATMGRKTNHILINYIYEYGGIDSISFKVYYALLYKEFKNRGFRFNDKYQMVNWFYVENPPLDPFLRHHTTEYLTMNYWNLREKFIRKQRDFTTEVWEKLDTFYQQWLKENGDGE